MLNAITNNNLIPQLSHFSYNDENYYVYRLDVYSDSNFWDTSVLDDKRNIQLDLHFISTDFDNSTDYYINYVATNIYIDNSSFTSQFLSNSDFQYNFIELSYNSYSLDYNSVIQENSITTLNNSYSWNYAEYLYVFVKGENLWLDQCVSSYWSDSSLNNYYILGYNDGYNLGYNNGTSQGYSDGYNDGLADSNLSSLEAYNKGYNVGYDEGYIQGESSDYINQISFKEGYYKGYGLGYNTGYQTGYYDGYNNGLNVEDEQLSSMVVSVAETPINVFKQIFDFDVLGINVVGLFLGFISFSLILWVIKRFFN